jgi:uncharacterized protein YyaL (SSP411 family)
MGSLRVLPREVAWLPWGAAAFARARVERKPVLLNISVPWSRACEEMDRTSYGDPAIAFLINDAFVPIRVDADRRPDVSDRYALGGWPTTAFLTADGAVIGGGTFVDPARLRRALDEVRAACDRGLPAPGAAAPPAEPAVTGAIEAAALTARIFETFDAEHGGFGEGAKFPLVAPLHLALARVREAGDDRLAGVVTTTLDAMGWGGLHDETDGGFFRCCARRDWQEPSPEKTLDVNAQLLRLYADASETLGAARFGARALDVAGFLQDVLADREDGGWSASQRGDDGRLDRTIFTDANAVAVSATLRAAALFADDALRDFALKSLERVLLAAYKPGGGVAHYLDGGAQVRGLLTDQVAMGAALLDAFDTTGNVVYEMMAEELAHYALRELWDEAAGLFADRAAAPEGDVGLMRLPLRPFVANCDAAAMLARLAARSGESDFGRIARTAIGALAPMAAAQGPLAAHYVLARETT